MAPTPPPRTHALTWTVVTILLAASLVATLWVPFYARTGPKLGSFPFFYWYQLIWVPIVAVLSLLAYLLTRSTERGGGGPAPGGPASGGPAGEGADLEGVS